MKHIINVISDSHIGGAGMVLINYFKAENRAEFKHTVVLPTGSALNSRLTDLGVRTIEIDGIAERSFSTAAVSELKKLFQSEQPDIVHSHGCLSARVAARLYGKCKLVFTRHSYYDVPKSHTMFPRKLVSGMLNNKLSDMIIAISPPTRDFLIATGTNPKKIVTMFNGVPPITELNKDERSALRTEIGIHDSDFVCSIVARLVDEKGHDYILKAAKLLEGDPIRFLIAGTGPKEAELKANAPSNCVFLGFVSDVGRVHNITDVQLNASFGTETSSLSLLEGMSVGVPMIASDFGGNPYLVRDGVNGLVVPAKDGKAIADAVLKLYKDSELLRQMRLNAKEIYRKEYTAEVMANNIDNVYRRLIK